MSYYSYYYCYYYLWLLLLLLPNKKADPTVRNSSNQGIVEKAVEDENEIMIKFLLENGYVNDPNFKFTPGQFDFNYNEQDEEEDEEDDNNNDNNNNNNNMEEEEENEEEEQKKI